MAQVLSQAEMRTAEALVDAMLGDFASGPTAAQTAARLDAFLEAIDSPLRSEELNRTESLSAAEIAGYKATRAGEKIFDASIKTANAGIIAWRAPFSSHFKFDSTPSRLF